MRTIAFIALAGLLTSCADTVACSPLDSSHCDFDTQRIEHCVGPANGGDEDGETMEGEDCAARELVCANDVHNGPVHAGCVTPTCSQVSACFEIGATVCSLGRVETCTAMGADCAEYVVVEDCTDAGQTCEMTASGAACVE